jgi:hypothetical protein
LVDVAAYAPQWPMSLPRVHGYDGGGARGASWLDDDDDGDELL